MQSISLINAKCGSMKISLAIKKNLKNTPLNSCWLKFYKCLKKGALEANNQHNFSIMQNKLTVFIWFWNLLMNMQRKT